MPLPSWHSPREVFDFIFRSTKRIVIFVVGVALVLLGVALIPLPGPFSIPLMLLGLAVLATEYVWAERILDTVKDKAKKASEVAKRSVFRRKSNDATVEAPLAREPDDLELPR
jgi:uncharacterized protein (TIGR02611 family)